MPYEMLTSLTSRLHLHRGLVSPTPSRPVWFCILPWPIYPCALQLPRWYLGPVLSRRWTSSRTSYTLADDLCLGPVLVGRMHLPWSHWKYPTLCMCMFAPRSVSSPHYWSADTDPMDVFTVGAVSVPLPLSTRRMDLVRYRLRALRANWDA